MTQDALENKREQLEDLEKSEREARRLEEALGRGRVSGLSSSLVIPNHENAEDAPELATANSLPPHPGPNPARRRTKPPGMGLLNALSYTLHGIMDVDPETARRNGITKTRENISQVRLSFLISIHLLHSILGSLKTLYIWPHRTSNILAPLYKPIWIDFNGRRLLIYERCRSAWLEVTETGARRLVSLFVQYYDRFFHLLHRFEYRTWKHGKRRRGKSRRYLIIPTRQLKFQKKKLRLQTL
jgi:hypothetical protein